MSEDREVVVGLDIGTTKIAAVVGEADVDGSLTVLGVGTHPSTGLRKGVVVNIDATVNSIREAIAEAGLMAGCEIATVYAGIAGGHISSVNSPGVVGIKDREVTQQDVERVIDAASAVAMPMDREIIHVLPKNFVVDDQDGIKDPVGMRGVRLEAQVHLVTAAVTSAQNIIKCCNMADLDVADIVLEPLASALSTLDEDEKELGVALVDIGGGTTDIAIFLDGSVVHTSILTIGGDHLTSDVAVGLRTPRAEAERIKQQWGYALVNSVGEEETVEVPSTGGREPRIVPRRLLASIIEPRVEEIFRLVYRELDKANYADLLGAGVVITGGSASLPGMAQLAEHILDMPVRVGLPKDVKGLVGVINSPKFATGVGLVKYGAENDQETHFRVLNSDDKPYSRMMRRMRDWWREVF
ncbi:MAG: cell division protein FtsA [Deltaproteobacteria bacterium]|nr:cell division protein FtsA [Deltaproteobacteria bacterium]